MADIIMNDVVKAILDRRSIRKYADKQITEEELQTLLTCAFNAPSGGNSQSWFISVVQDKEVLENMNKAFVDGILSGPNADDKARERFGNPDFSVYFHAPTVMFISYPKSGVETNASLLGENIVLAAQSLGLGTCYLGGIIGMVIMLVLGYLGSTELLTPTNVLLYQLIWAIPGLLVTEWTRVV